MKYEPKPWWFPAKAKWTTIGDTVWYPPDIDNPLDPQHDLERRHEAVHVKQYERWALIPFLLAYLLVPFPIGFAYFRWRFERAAYLVQIDAGVDIEQVVGLLGSVHYGWCWPKGSMRRWFERNRRGAW